MAERSAPRLRSLAAHAALLGLLVYTWQAGQVRGEPPADSTGGLRFREVSREAGIDFVHRPTRVDPLVAGIEAQITAVGAAVSVADVDADGWPDLYAVSSAHGAPNALYRNRGDGTFEELAERAGLADLNREGQGCSMGSVWADYDADLDEDVFVYAWGRSRLLRNEGGLTFTDVTAGSGLEAWINSNAATWLDYDRDGNLDLYVTAYFSEEHDLWHLETTRIMQDSFEFSRNGGRNRLFRGRGDGTFEDVSERCGADSTRWTYAAVAADFDRDGWPDLYLANDYGPEELYLNRGGERFELAQGIGLEAESKSGMCVALGDATNTGRLSVYVTNISKRGFIFQGNNLRVSHVDRGGPLVQVADEAAADCGWAWGAQFGDLDRDGAQDLVVVNGFISQSRERDYWYQMTKIAGATAEVIADAARWPPFEDRSLSGYERSSVLRCVSPRSASYVEVGAEAGIDDLYDGRAVALADLFGSGRLDVVVANQGGPLLVYKNESRDANHWLAFELRATHGHPSALGAEVELEFAGVRQLQVVVAASGFASQNQRRLHFGLGPAPGRVRALIRWPSGRQQVLEDLELDRVHAIFEDLE